MHALHMPQSCGTYLATRVLLSFVSIFFLVAVIRRDVRMSFYSKYVHMYVCMRHVFIVEYHPGSSAMYTYARTISGSSQEVRICFQ